MTPSAQRRRKSFLPWLLTLMCAATFLFGTAAQAETPQLKPYTARYAVKYRGLSGGEIEFRLRSVGQGRYTFSSHLLPNMLGSIFASDQAEDTSEFLFTDGSIKPLRFRSEDGTAKTDKDIALDFDWNQHLVTGTARDQTVRLELPDGALERLSIQLAASLALQAGREPGVLAMVERNEVQQFRISRSGKERITTPAGQYDTVVLNSERMGGSSRSTRYWYAEQLGYIPARAERSTKGKVDIVMELKSFKAEP